ncbi:MAG: photosynthetic reaction center cytochrome c subunit [Betaproteobacteria bacterium]|nr:MAG: photosynthetic reaction center cytochrome c subunit [Betaproteobacteria bacterium]
MMRRSNAAASWSMAAAMLCLLAGASLRAGQSAPEASLVSEQYFKNIQVLKGMPVDTFFDAMGMFAASMGNDCTFCHAKEAGFRREAFAETTPRIQRARQMIGMMQALNEQYFGGRPRVTCFTCHRGQYAPVSAPSFLIQYGVPTEDPDIIDFPTEQGVSADQVFDRYLTAIGGTAALAKITSFTATGTYAGFDTGQEEVPVQIFAKAPNQRTWIVKLPQGDSYRVFDGVNGWIAGPDSPAPLFTLVTGNLDRARIEAILAFPAAIKQLYPRWRAGRTLIDDRDVIVMQGTAPGLLPVNFYFDDKTGLLVRVVRWNQTPVGPVPSEINYGDYRTVAGIQMPFTWTATQTYMQMTITLREVSVNVPVDASRFAKPREFRAASR